MERVTVKLCTLSEFVVKKAQSVYECQYTISPRRQEDAEDFLCASVYLR